MRELEGRITRLEHALEERLGHARLSHALARDVTIQLEHERSRNANLLAQKNAAEISAAEGTQTLDTATAHWSAVERELTNARAELLAEVTSLRHRLAVFEGSRSWRVTAPLRAARRQLQALQRRCRIGAAKATQSAYRRLPLPHPLKMRVKDLLFRHAAVWLQDTGAYAAWKAFHDAAHIPANPTAATAPAEPLAEHAHAHESGPALSDIVAPVNTELGRPSDIVLMDSEATAGGMLPTWITRDAYVDHVPLAARPVAPPRVKLIAFFLPQFHSIPENNAWWGRGFTDWTNVVRARPRFAGHYQPHLPGELGFYDLRVREVRQRQIELARLYGVHGFCLYYYWFSGQRLLSEALDQILADPDLDFPFCLCWANENWTRRWDGQDQEVLISQQYGPDDDHRFIDDIAPALRDPRYIRTAGRLVLLVYRPELLPDPTATAARWREYCRDAGLGELFLVSTQSFGSRDPRDFGFDAAVDFPPNSRRSQTPAHVSNVAHDFRGAVCEYDGLVADRVASYSPSPYPLLPCVTPMWDNGARRHDTSLVFAGSTPAKYQQWLEDACRHTERHIDRATPYVFVNAWNEWAEGAHLEPDQRFGYAYLQATANALSKFPVKAPVVCVSHDAQLNGAQLIALNLARTLAGPLSQPVEILLCDEGPLRAEFEAVGSVHELFASTPRATQRQILSALADRGARIAYCNTSVVGDVVAELKELGFTVISLIHELPGIIEQLKLQRSTAIIARDADYVVFPATRVADRFLESVGAIAGTTVIRPQGLYLVNSHKGRREDARREIASRLDIDPARSLVIGVGYGDYRKGFDLFVETALKLLSDRPDCVFIWTGNYEPDLFAQMRQRIEAAGRTDAFVFPGPARDPAPFFAAADAYLLTSREDPFPSVVLEALDAEVPVLAFAEGGGFVELLEQGCGELVPDFDTTQMATALRRLLEPQSPHRRMYAAAGRHVIDTRFSFLDYAQFLLHLPKRFSVSAIVPNYNYARYLPARLQSILAQTYPPAEIIFLDDASTDESIAVARSILERSHVPFRIVANAKNQGCYRQWLSGIREATGDLIWIAEADDGCEPDFLATLVPAFERPEVVLAYCQSRPIDGDGRELAADYTTWTDDISTTKWRAPYVRRGLDEVLDSLVVKNTIPNASAVVMRRANCMDVDLQLVRFKNAGDWFVYVQLLESGDIAFRPEVLNHHRRHADGLTLGPGGLNLMAETLIVQQHVLARHEIAESTEQARQIALQGAYEHLGLSHGNPGSYRDHPALRPLLRPNVGVRIPLSAGEQAAPSQ